MSKGHEWLLLVREIEFLTDFSWKFSLKKPKLEIFATSDIDSALVKLPMGSWEGKSVNHM